MFCAKRAIFQAITIVLVIGLVWAVPLAAAQHEEQHAADASHEESESHGGGHETSSPVNWDQDLGIFSLVVFGGLFFVLYKFAWGPLSAALDGREQSLLDAHDGAQKARDEAEQLLEEHRHKLDLVQDEVREILEEARRDAQHTSQAIQSRAEQEAEETRERALRDVERARDQALQDITAQASRMVIETSSRVIQSSLNEQDHQRLIEESLAEFSASDQ